MSRLVRSELWIVVAVVSSLSSGCEQRSASKPPAMPPGEVAAPRDAGGPDAPPFEDRILARCIAQQGWVDPAFVNTARTPFSVLVGTPAQLTSRGASYTTTGTAQQLKLQLYSPAAGDASISPGAGVEVFVVKGPVAGNQVLAGHPDELLNYWIAERQRATADPVRLARDSSNPGQPIFIPGIGCISYPPAPMDSCTTPQCPK